MKGPILFNGPMIRAVLADRKSNTRRVMNPQPEFAQLYEHKGKTLYDGENRRWCWKGHVSDIWQEPTEALGPLCPHGTPGTLKWVQETHTITEWKERWDTGAATREVRLCGYYDADQKPFTITLTEREAALFDKRSRKLATVPGRLMYRSLSRLTLEITGIRVERVQEISEEDVTAEGVTQELIDAMIDPAAARQKVLSDHWVYGADEGSDYCHRCCVKRIKALLKEKPAGEFQVDGGWGSEHDSIPTCATCGAILSGSLTDYGAQSEIEHFLECGLNLRSPDDCYCLQRALAAGTWDPWPWREQLKDYEQERDAAKVLNARRLGWRILWDSINGKTHPWERNPWLWCIEFRRVQP